MFIKPLKKEQADLLPKKKVLVPSPSSSQAQAARPTIKSDTTTHSVDGGDFTPSGRYYDAPILSAGKGWKHNILKLVSSRDKEEGLESWRGPIKLSRKISTPRPGQLSGGSTNLFVSEDARKLGQEEEHSWVLEEGLLKVKLSEDGSNPRTDETATRQAASVSAPRQIWHGQSEKLDKNDDRHALLIPETTESGKPIFTFVVPHRLYNFTKQKNKAPNAKEAEAEKTKAKDPLRFWPFRKGSLSPTSTIKSGPRKPIDEDSFSADENSDDAKAKDSYDEGGKGKGKAKDLGQEADLDEEAYLSDEDSEDTCVSEDSDNEIEIPFALGRAAAINQQQGFASANTAGGSAPKSMPDAHQAFKGVVHTKNSVSILAATASSQAGTSKSPNLQSTSSAVGLKRKIRDEVDGSTRGGLPTGHSSSASRISEKPRKKSKNRHLNESMVISFLREKKHATTKDCAQKFQSYTRDEEGLKVFTEIVKKVAFEKNGVLVLRDQYA